MTGIAAVMFVALPGVDDIEEDSSRSDSSSMGSDYGEMPEEEGEERK